MALDGQPARFLVGGHVPVPGPPELVDPRRHGRRHGPVPAVRDDPQLPPPDPPQRRDPPRRRAGRSASSTSPRATNVNGGPGPGDRRAERPDRGRASRGPDAGHRRPAPAHDQRHHGRGFPGLGDLPIVGPWFSNNRIETVETETIILVTPELVAPLEKNEVTEAPGDRVYPAQRRRVLLPGPDRGQARPRVPGDQRRAGPAEPDEALPEREAVGRRPPRLRRLSHGLVRSRRTTRRGRLIETR